MEIDECLPRPCENGGTCTDLVNGYLCDCGSEFSVRFLWSLSVVWPAKNTMFVPLMSYDLTQSVREWLAYSRCPANTNDLAMPLIIVMSCLKASLNAIITCVWLLLSTWHLQGKNCETDLNSCRSNLCTNGSTCVNLPDGFRCSCAPGFTGFDCSTEVEGCELSPCVHGNCSVSNHYYCTEYVWY